MSYGEQISSTSEMSGVGVFDRSSFRDMPETPFGDYLGQIRREGGNFLRSLSSHSTSDKDGHGSGNPEGSTDSSRDDRLAKRRAVNRKSQKKSRDAKSNLLAQLLAENQSLRKLVQQR